MTEPRQLALEALYELEQVPEADISSDQLAGKALRLVEGVRANRETIDRHIEEVSEHWRLSRMPLIDVTILRIGAFELLFDDTPVAVVINEAVELAKEYSTQASGSFVNGLLAGLAESVRPGG